MKSSWKHSLLAAIVAGQVHAHAKPQEKPWSVDAPPGPSTPVTIDVTRGTWLSLDVSPDGKTLAFDLLGDLYLLDISGGEARPLTSGIAWDMQPRFSPDGTKIAFTSDRGGGDNLWIIPVSGGKPQAVSEETFRLLNQPVWDTTGPYLLGRKHFTGTRSLGAGEIWSYHTSGDSDGVQLTKRSNDQLDLGEPALSPDGRYLYYSSDVTGGSTFQYNKDPNAGIYAIDRLDRVTGEIRRMAGGAGGACTPTPSPDGKTLAFVRRVRGKSVLMVKELGTGQETPLFDGLDRDMQETWAIHGLYPRMAWTPDSQELVFWAGGRFWRLPKTGAEPREIPFHVKSQRAVHSAVRFPVNVAPVKIDVKAVRSPQLSSDGKTLVFAALGKLWSKSGTAAPARITAATTGHEAHPRLLGDQLLYTRWSDQELGSIRQRSLSSGSESVLVENGRFADPVLSPDGHTLVYRKLGSNSLYNQLYTMGPGLYLKDLASPMAEPRLLDSSARDPHFTTEPNVLYFTRPGENTQLVRKELDTGRERVLFEGKDLDTIVLSPDGTRGYFTENLQLYTFPVTLTGRTVELGSGASGLPIKKVSNELGAYYPSWSSSGELLWNSGPLVFRQGKEPQNVSWPVAADLSKGTVAMVGGQVVSMKGEEVIPDGTVVIQGDRIVAVGPTATVDVPAGAKTFDCKGKTIMPGLVDVHWHGSFSDEENPPETNWVGLSSLSFGVTTLHDPSNDTASVFTAKELQRIGDLVAPRIFSTGTILYGAKAAGYYAPVNSVTDAEGHLKRLKGWGANSVKSYNQPRREQRQQILDAARREQMMVVPEGGSLLEHNLTMVVDGHTGVEHALPVAQVYDDVVALWSGTQVGYTPTLGVAYGGQWGENYWYVETNVWEDERLNQFVPRELIDAAARRRTRVPDDEHNHVDSSEVANQLSKAGVRVNLGAHGQREGLAAHWELWMLVQGGMTPHQALRCGTLNGARYLGMDKDLGSLEPGKLADLIVVDGDPLADIHQSKKVEMTVLGGRVYDSASMKELAPTPGAEPKLWWRQK